MSVASTIESTLIDVSHEPLSQVINADDSWLQRAVNRIQAEASSGDSAAAVAAFNSSL